ncbi:ABC transporter, ATP binding protein [Aeropyrum pernix K1]|uniref:ABC transporter, ATP binding protein n=1 Tax=Aeropyrum pernix (strain ATCC 700893 / DSM 11879 / JCM 9820 / NBRC 100138 / K1) TaxID=272557 RepID=Q9YBQ1_AERPE|nr:ABC transporter ATP-binding protein [Aeropyrum pernix]BAA80547.2 ABC transporter, ATP binding protein [Aeropyrum pernix K1]
MGCTVEARGLRKRFGGRTAVAGVSFSVGDGERACIMGPNGSGKTTLLRMVSGVLRPSGGSVRVCGYDVWGDGWREARGLIGFAPQDPPMARRMTGAEYITVVGGLLGLSPGVARREARRVLEMLGFEDVLGRVVARLSGGQRRALGIALALASNPEVVVLDEPGSGLDVRARESLWASLRKAFKGRTVLFSSHDPQEAEAESDRVLIMHRGRLAAWGKPRELIQRYAPKPRVRVWADRAPDGLEPVHTGPGFSDYLIEAPGDVARIASAYSGAGILVERIEVLKPSLREVFFAVTGEEMD